MRESSLTIMNEDLTPPEETGIDVWLALEAYDLAVHKRFDILVLVAGHQDFVPLIRKVNGIGTQVMLLADGVKWTDNQGKDRYIKTSPRLSNEASYRILLSDEIDAPDKNDRVIDELFQK